MTPQEAGVILKKAFDEICEGESDKDYNMFIDCIEPYELNAVHLAIQLAAERGNEWKLAKNEQPKESGDYCVTKDFKSFFSAEFNAGSGWKYMINPEENYWMPLPNKPPNNE